jgi:uncharacterized membrane protein YcaP (DUF421 family)
VNWSQTWHDLTNTNIGVGDKAIRTVLVYLGLVVLLRLSGKRVLSQLNTFDLVVVLLLSNVVQNAIIGPDNSLVGGLLGAAILIGFNAIWERLISSSSRLSGIVEGHPTVLIEGGKARPRVLQWLGVRPADLNAELRGQGVDRVEDVQSASLEPRGTISLELTEQARSVSYGELRAAHDALRHAFEDMREHFDRRLDERLGELEATLAAALEPALRSGPGSDLTSGPGSATSRPEPPPAAPAGD